MKTKAIMLGMLLAVALSLAVSGANPNVDATAAGNETTKQMTFGQCVSAGADEKNTCYSAVKATLASCRDSAENQTDSRAASKACKADYKRDKKQCKLDFKAAKKECKKIKHNAWDSVKASFK